MSERLRVPFEEHELEEMRLCAGREGLSFSEWVRRTLHDAVVCAPAVGADCKLAVIRAAAVHEFPTADVNQMLDEIHRGRGQSSGLERMD